jgi:Ca-activated chloride channel family protein
MSWTWIIRGAAVVAMFSFSRQVEAQTRSEADQNSGSYSLRLSVDEVVLTFHATDTHGLPVNDLKLDEFRLLDDGATLRRIVSFDSLIDRPIRAGILLDTSESLERALPGNKLIAERYAERLFRQKSDQAIVMYFGCSSGIAQSWTSDPLLLSQSIRNVRQGAMNPLGCTAIVDTVFRACFYGFGKVDPTASGNFILLFSDGEDNASHTSLEDPSGACQRSNTVIYAFRTPPGSDDYATGAKLLADLASKTGGRVFLADVAEESIWNDLRTIESEMRNQYRVVYNPANLKHDGAFHQIELQPPDGVSKIEVRSGYYAPVR